MADSRTVTKTVVSPIMTTATAMVALARDGGLSKFDVVPSGGGDTGTVLRSVPGGIWSIVLVVLVGPMSSNREQLLKLRLQRCRCRNGSFGRQGRSKRRSGFFFQYHEWRN